MQTLSVWKQARSPNYKTNVDKEYPYSEVPFLGEYNLIKIPYSLSELIDHVDYWGEGKIVTSHGRSGYENCYNVNHTFQLVSNGEDRDRKIPNRIPVLSSTNCDTSAYIRGNSVKTVTLMGAPINKSCASDIARIVNTDVGKVVVFGFNSGSPEIANLIDALKIKDLYECPNYDLPEELQGSSSFDSHFAFLNVTMLKDRLYKLVIDGEFDQAVALSSKLDKDGARDVLTATVQKLLESNSAANTKLMSFAYKLWNGEEKDIVRNNFPPAFKLIFGQENVTILNSGYVQVLKLDTQTDSYNDRLAWGDSNDRTSTRVSWRFVPVWENKEVTFKLFNAHYDMYLKLDASTDDIGDRQAWGSKNSGEERHRFYLEPTSKSGSLTFYIINFQFKQGLKLVAQKDSYGDRLLMGHNGDIHVDETRFRWTFALWGGAGAATATK
ncbi:unnamed protein product [Arctia plantaginis]|uniref:Uncharacterized protein n=1 Tax=Arctia plantaginis TaxID=874455 RepID=A0A8S1ADB4_ARCPL|nr:unnamed protein product [Arctia plantaginis]